jgi:hypothetical protein
MRTITPTKGFLSGAAALALVFAIVAMPLTAGAVGLEEGETNGVAAGGIVPDHAHFVGISTNIGAPKITGPGGTGKGADCEVVTGNSTVVYDGACTINNVAENPCVITGATITFVAITTTSKTDPGCFAPAGLTSQAGEIISVTTSGPLAGCSTGGAFLPWTSETGGFIIGLVSTFQNPVTTLTSASCPEANAGGIGVVTSYPP